MVAATQRFISFSKQRKKLVSSGRRPPCRCWKLKKGSGTGCAGPFSEKVGKEGAAMFGSVAKREDGIVPVGKSAVVVMFSAGNGGSGCAGHSGFEIMFACKEDALSMLDMPTRCLKS